MCEPKPLLRQSNERVAADTKKPLFILADQERQQQFKYFIEDVILIEYFAKVQYFFLLLTAESAEIAEILF